MSSSVERYDVVIAGGGTAGLALACALADALGPATSIAVVDPAPLRAGGAPDARAFALSAGAKRMLTVLGVWPELAPHAQPVTAIDITDSSLEDAFRPVLVSYDNTVDGSEPATYIVEQGRLRDALLAAAGSRRSVTLLGGAPAVGFQADEHGVSVAVGRGPSQRSLRAALLVAADVELIALAENDGRVLWRMSSPNGQAFGPPVLDYDGTLYAPVKGGIAALKIGAGPAVSAWPMHRQNPRQSACIQRSPTPQLRLVTDRSGQVTLQLVAPGGCDILKSSDLRTWQRLCFQPPCTEPATLSITTKENASFFSLMLP
jgi:hypothetical protein